MHNEYMSIIKKWIIFKNTKISLKCHALIYLILLAPNLKVFVQNIYVNILI